MDNSEWRWLWGCPPEDVAAAFTAALGEIVVDTRVVHDTVARARRLLDAGPATGVDEAVAGLEQALTDTQPTPATVTDGDGRVTPMSQLREENHRLRFALMGERDRADTHERRADRAEDLVGKLRKRIIDNDTAHAAEVDRLTADHARRMQEAKQDGRSALAEAQKVYTHRIQALMTAHAARLAQLGSGRPREWAVGPDAPSAPESAPGPDRWFVAARDAQVVAGADPHDAHVYGMLTPPQQLVLAAMAHGVVTASIANAQGMSPDQLDRHLLTIRRRFRRRGEPEISEMDLRVIGRALFGLDRVQE